MCCARVCKKTDTYSIRYCFIAFNTLPMQCSVKTFARDIKHPQGKPEIYRAHFAVFAINSFAMNKTQLIIFTLFNIKTHTRQRNQIIAQQISCSSAQSRRLRMYSNAIECKHFTKLTWLTVKTNVFFLLFVFFRIDIRQQKSCLNSHK